MDTTRTLQSEDEVGAIRSVITASGTQAGRPQLKPVSSLRAFVVVDGNSGAGKTTTAAALSTLLNTAPPLPEQVLYAQTPTERVLDFPPHSAQEVIETNRLWLMWEHRRQHDLRLRPGLPDAMFVVDNSSLSVLGFELAKRRLGYPSAVEDLAARYAAAYCDGTLAEPNGWVFVATAPPIVLDRIARRGGSVPLLKREDTIEYLDLLRRRFASDYLEPATWIWVDNSQVSLGDVAAGCARFARDLDPTVKTECCRMFFVRVATDPAFLGQLLKLGS